MTDIHTSIREKIASAQNIMLSTHVRPDGDALGSLIGLGLALENAGKTVQMVSVDGVPAVFRFVPGHERVRKQVEGMPDLSIALDCAEFKRAGNAFDGVGKPGINIDHHITNDQFADINLIQVDQVATSAILVEHLGDWGLAITPEVATALMTGLLTDTLGFRTSNTTPRALRQAATLMEAGANMHHVYMRSLISRTFNAARYWGAGLSSLQRADGIVWATLRLEDRKLAGYNSNDDADLISVISSIDDCSVSMIFVEQHQKKVKVSWRAQKPGLDVSGVAKQFGGGGHQAAAGAEIPGDLAEVQAKILESTKNLLGL